MNTIAKAAAAPSCVASITATDIQTAATTEDLDAAILGLQTLAGIDDGGVASICFSGFDWSAADKVERIAQINSWLNTESAYSKADESATPPAPLMDSRAKARALAYTVVALWADTEWHNTERLETECDNALRLTFQAVRALDLSTVGEVGFALDYFATAFLDDINPADLTFCEMVESIRAKL